MNTKTSQNDKVYLMTVRQLRKLFVEQLGKKNINAL
jgi:hypothetical protein